MDTRNEGGSVEHLRLANGGASPMGCARKTISGSKMCYIFIDWGSCDSVDQCGFDFGSCDAKDVCLVDY